MKKLGFVLLLLVLALTGCENTEKVITPTCTDTEELVEGKCKEKEVVLLDCDKGEFDMNGECTLIRPFTVMPSLRITEVGETTVAFTVFVPESEDNYRITELNIITGDTVIPITDLTARSASNLLSDTQYTLEYTYTHDYTNLTETRTAYFKTYGPLTAPSFSLKIVGDVTESYVMIKSDTTDERNIIEVTSSVLTDDSGKEIDVDYNKLLSIYNLAPLTEYDYTVTYQYDIGNGIVTDSDTIHFETPSLVLDYFNEIALGFEFGDASEIVRKWDEPMKIFVDGKPNDDLLNELDNIILELNNLFTDGFYIEVVDTVEESNFVVVFESGSYYSSTYNIPTNLTSANWGLFAVRHNEDGNIYEGVMYVDIYRADRAGQLHILREELTQALGLGNDSGLFTDSIFYDRWTTTSTYMNIDKDLIWLLYNPAITSGLTEEEATEIITDLIKKGIPEH